MTTAICSESISSISFRGCVMRSLVTVIALFLALCFGLTALVSDVQAQEGENAQIQEIDVVPTLWNEGWEFSIGGGFGGLYDVSFDESMPEHLDYGFTFMGSLGYRFNSWFSLNFEQSVIHDWKRFADPEEKNTMTVVESVVTVKFIYANRARDIEFYVKLGAGLVYGSDYVDPLGCIWSIPMGIGMNFFITDNIGLGFDLQYEMIIIEGFLKGALHLAFRY